MSRLEASKRLIEILQNFGIVVIPIGVITGIVQWVWRESDLITLYTTLAVLFSTIGIYLIWIELRVRDIEKKEGVKNG